MQLVPCQSLVKSRRAATAIEYALVCAFIAVVIATTLALTGQDLETAFQRVVQAFP